MLKIDTSGKDCPIPLFELQKAVASSQPGETIELTFTCPEAIQNVSNYCAKNNYQIEQFAKKDQDSWVVKINI
ncbi:sulfurtransferase TusA family protein [Limosilactobacillus antri]|uniref:sulfurtransferase TusA family protein n=1 Tax=Limosilactobacillus antri TaxID=227943 RepID=UPI001F58F969|nr:sulfurtransferase TusA family protein [Limosilactobacillus antri]